MPMFGADIEALRQLATTFRNKADELDTDVDAVLTQALHSSPWEGPDAEAFRSSWSTQLTPRIQEAVAALRSAAVDLQRNADEQERASEGEGAGGGGPEEEPTEPPIKKRRRKGFIKSEHENSGIGQALSGGGSALEAMEFGHGGIVIAQAHKAGVNLAGAEILDDIAELDKSFASKIKGIGVLGNIATGLQIAGDFMQGMEYYAGERGMGFVEATARTTAFTAVKLGLNATASSVGYGIGAAIGAGLAGPFAPIGAFVGGFVGAYVVPQLVNLVVKDEIIHASLDLAANAIGGVTNALVDAGKAVGDFIGGLFS